MTSDSQNIKGLSNIINKAHAKPDVDFTDIENFLASEGTINKSAIDDKYDQDIQMNAKKAGIDLSFLDNEPEPPRVEHRVRFEEPAEAPPMEMPFQPQTQQHDYPPYDTYAQPKTTHFTNTEQFTQEQMRRSEISGAMNNMGNDGGVWSIEKEKTEDAKSTMLEQIDSLRDGLEEDGVDVSRVPNVTQESPVAEVESVLRILRLKNDRMRYCSFAEEFLLFGAYGLEELFNGENIWFGKYQPDLRGWHSQVAVKLRRMRHDTSTLVSGIMQDYNMGSASRILLELVPSAFMYSKTRKEQSQSKSLVTEDTMLSSINSIRDVTERN